MCANLGEGDNEVVSPLEMTQFNVGDNVTFDGVTEDDFEWKKVKKVKNIAENWDVVCKELRTDGEGFVVLNGHKLLINGVPLKSELKNADVK